MEVKHYWEPTDDIIRQSNIHAMMVQNGLETYEELWTWSVTHTQEFWKQTIENLEIQYEGNIDAVYSVEEGVENAQWLRGAQVNIVDSCFRQSSDATALVFRKPNGALKKVSSGELEDLVNRVGNSLVRTGLVPGDRIAIGMPMTLEAVAIFLGGINIER